jgi:hypothetical protein
MYSAIHMLAWAQIRPRWRATVALTLFVGLVGGLSIALIAGSRRSATVVDRFFATARHYDAAVSVSSWDLPTKAELLAIPGVKRADVAAYIALNFATDRNGPATGIDGFALNFSAVDPTDVVLAGAVPDDSDPATVVVNEAFVQRFGRSVGDLVSVRTFAVDQSDAVSTGAYQPKGPIYRFRIGGVVRTVGDIAFNDMRVPGRSAAAKPAMMSVSERWYAAHRSEFLDFGGIYNVELREGARGTKAFAAAVAALAHNGEKPPQVIPPQTNLNPSSVATPVHVETTSLLLLGIGVGLAAAIALVLALRAEQRLHDPDNPIMRALGGTTRQLGLVASVRALPIGLGGGALAVATALVLSPRFPIGIGREVELDRGLHVDLAAVAVGLGAIVLVVLVSAFLFGLPRRGHDRPAARPQSVANWVGRAGAPADVTIAAHLAFDHGRSVRRGPASAAIAGGAALLAVSIGVGVYVSGIDHLYRDPNAHGWAWDLAVGNSNFPLNPHTTARLAADRRVAAATTGSYGSLSLNDGGADFLVFDPRGTAPPEVVAGRLPTRAGEVALGPETMRKLRVNLGSTVRLDLADSQFDGGHVTGPMPVTVVGTALAPVFGDVDVGEVGLAPYSTIAAAGGATKPQLVLMHLRGGRSARTIAAIDRDYTEDITTDLIPARVLNFHRVRRLPIIGLAVAGTIALFVLLYALALGIRIRNRDLAILRALGLPARRVRRVLTWFGCLLAAGIVAIGVPTGLLLGIAIWHRIATNNGMRPTAAVSPYLWLTVPLTFAAAVLGTLAPGRRALRQNLNALLRPE